jgi:hypothetical protein
MQIENDYDKEVYDRDIGYVAGGNMLTPTGHLGRADCRTAFRPCRLGSPVSTHSGLRADCIVFFTDAPIVQQVWRS